MPSIVGGNLKLYHGVSISYHELTMAAVSVVLMGGLGLFLARTRWGFAIRAVAQDLDAARSLGVPVNRLYPLTMGLASALAGVGGVFLGALYFASPTAGDLPLLQALIVVVLGGLGSLTGHALRGVSGRADAGVLRGRDRHDLDAADPVRGDPDHPHHPALRAQGQPDGGAAVTGHCSAAHRRPVDGDRRRVVLAALFPLVYTDPYYMTIIVTAEIVLILNISWNFVLGMAGVWNFGQLAIYALGAYGCGLADAAPDVDPGAGRDRPRRASSRRSISVLLAFPTLRLFGIYTSLLTFSFAAGGAVRRAQQPREPDGRLVRLPDGAGRLLDRDPGRRTCAAYYWLCAVVIVVACFVVAWLRQSHLGIALRSVRDAPGLHGGPRRRTRAAVRVVAFGLSGFLAGVAGALYLCVRAVVHDQPDGAHADVDRRHDARHRRPRHGLRPAHRHRRS